MQDTIGITSTMPIEILYAAGLKPVDLNNYFIASDDPKELVALAEKEGFPRNCCSWIKGIFSSCIELGIDSVVGLMSGDCNQTQILCQVLEGKGIRILPFCFPHDRNPDYLKAQMEELRCRTGTTWERINETKRYFDRIRGKVQLIDEATWRKDFVHGRENHLFQISCSDMKGNPEGFEREVDDFLLNMNKRMPLKRSVRLGFIGIPPILDDIYEFCESVGGRIIFNEIQRQFSMPFDCKDILDQYLRYTYPYVLKWRVKDILTEVKRRCLDGLIHYCQSFCFRNMEDLIFRKYIDIPILSIEGDMPGNLDARTKMRIESFIEMLRESEIGGDI